MKFRPVKIGELTAQYPIIQGGMGVGISRSNLAGAVASQGGIGVISAAQIGYDDDIFYQNPVLANMNAIKKHINEAKKKAKGGIVGVNIMAASNHYNDYVKKCAELGADIIISGAGLPVSLPELVKGTSAKIAPIVSSLKAVNVLFKTWDKRYGNTADMVVIEGPEAGGHLGFKSEGLERAAEGFDKEITDIINFVRTYEGKYNRHIPVIFGGGIDRKARMDQLMALGIDGVQIATRFVTTEECDASDYYKRTYIDAQKEDICIIKSPVGLPGRAIKNDFIERTFLRPEPISKCLSCLSHCSVPNIPYCITEALINAVKGNVNDGLIFCGANAYKETEITTVKRVLQDFLG